jgi:hypothetical protein
MRRGVKFSGNSDCGLLTEQEKCCIAGIAMEEPDDQIIILALVCELESVLSLLRSSQCVGTTNSVALGNALFFFSSSTFVIFLRLVNVVMKFLLRFKHV